ncbi:hypothetical protein ACI78Q_10975 [Geodermatophilus sp. SYSU D00705]
MSQGERAPLDPSTAAVLDEIKPYVVAVGAVSLFGTPAEVAVPIVRRLRGRSGVSAGPGLMNLGNGLVALGIAHYFRRRPAQWRRWRRERIPRRAAIAGLLYLTLSPAAAGWKRGVVFPGRSPLWGGFVSPIGLLQISLAVVALHRARRARSAGRREDAQDDSGADHGAGSP